MGRLILVLLLLVGPLSAYEDPRETVFLFLETIRQAEVWSDVTKFFDAKTVEAIEKLPPARQTSLLKEWRAKYEAMGGTVNEMPKQRIKGKTAVIEIRFTKATVGVQKYKLNLENGAWKIDFSDTFQGTTSESSLRSFH